MPKDNIIAGLDIGSGKIKLLVAKTTKKEPYLEILAMVEEVSSGVRRGVVIEPEEVSKILKLLLKKVENQVGQKIDSVYTNIGGAHIFSTSSRGLVSVSRADQKISEEDMARVLQAAETFPLSANKEILAVLPKEFIVDGEGGIKEPLGMKGVRLEAEVLVLAAFSPYLKNLTKAILNSDLQILDIIPSPLSSARAVLRPREKELGVALLDIGAGSSSLAVFEEKDLIHLAIFPIGSGHITNDIAIGFKTDIDTAERIKIEFGSSLLTGRKREKIEQKDGESLVISQDFLTKIIHARISEIFDLVNKELKKISRQASLPAGIVLTGGGAKLPKIKDFCQRVLKLPCRIGKPDEDFPFSDDLRLSSVWGLVLLGVDLEGEKKSADFEKGIFSKLRKILRIFIPS